MRNCFYKGGFFRLNRLAAISALIWAMMHLYSARATDGGIVWTNFVDGDLNNRAAIALDGDGNVIVTGALKPNGNNGGYGVIKYSGNGLPLWTNGFNGSPIGLVVDGGNNVIVAGYSPASSSTAGYATIKYSAAGVPLWTNIFNNDGIAAALVMDTNGNVFVTGYSGSPSDFATIKISNAGLPLWTNIFNGAANGDDVPTAMAIDSGGDVIVTGSATGSGTGRDFVTIKYSNAGLPMWTNFFNGEGNSTDRARSVAVDSQDRVMVTGLETTGVGVFKFATVSYSSAGVPLWTNITGSAGGGNANSAAIGVDGNDNVFVTGYTTGSSQDFTTIKLSNTGVPLWTNFFNGTNDGADMPSALALDKTGNAYVTGFSTFSSGSTAFCTIKYSNDGIPVWTNLFHFALPDFSRAYGLAVNNSGDVYVAGQSGNSFLAFTTVKYSGPAPVYFGFVTTNAVFGFENRFSVVLAGPVGSNAVIFASTDLQTWLPVFTNVLTDGSLTFTDLPATNFTRRYYRAELK